MKSQFKHYDLLEKDSKGCWMVVGTSKELTDNPNIKHRPRFNRV